MIRCLCLFALVVGALLVVGPRPAAACGGTFCNTAQPVNQSAEQIIFARHDDGSVTAVIRIQYEGPGERFAWLLPVVGEPEVSVASSAVFDALGPATAPVYRMSFTQSGTCADQVSRRPCPDRFSNSGGGGGLADSAPSAGDFGIADTSDQGSPSPPVVVLDAGSVGPYDYATIAIADGVEDPADEARAWLEDNGYDVNEFGVDRLAPYLEGGMNLVAFRLTKGADAGSIRPVRLSFGSGLPSIPIRPTAVAAEDDMGVLVWLLGESRAVPINFATVELNEAALNWPNANNAYGGFVTRAVNEAGGHAFVTEMAGSTAPLVPQLRTVSPLDAEQLASRDWTGQVDRLLLEIWNRYARLEGTTDLLRELVVLEDGFTFAELIESPWVAFSEGRARPREGLEPSTVLQRLDALVVGPILDTVALFDELPYVTRLFTTLSAHEMTLDPTFDFSPELGDVTNQHVLAQVRECSTAIDTSSAPSRYELQQDDLVVRTTGPWSTAVSSRLPNARRVLRYGAEGTGAVVADNRDAIAASLERQNETVASPPPDVEIADPVCPRDVVRDDGGLCAVGPDGAPDPSWALVLLAVAFVFRRRR